MWKDNPLNNPLNVNWSLIRLSVGVLTFHMKTIHLICTSNQMTGFDRKCKDVFWMSFLRSIYVLCPGKVNIKKQYLLWTNTCSKYTINILEQHPQALFQYLCRWLQVGIYPQANVLNNEPEIKVLDQQVNTDLNWCFNARINPFQATGFAIYPWKQ